MTAVARTTVQALLVQDRSAARTQLIEILQRDGDIRVIGPVATAADACVAIEQHRPEIIILDLLLGNGASQQVIEQVMARHPTPILVLSARIDDRRSPSAIQAMVAGALDALPVPEKWTTETEVGLRHSVRQLRKVVVVRHPRGGRTTPPRRPPVSGNRKPVVAIAASTGGPSALASVVAGLGGLQAPVLIVQHLHPDFTGGLLDLLTRASALPVEIAVHDAPLLPGRVYLGPGHLHLRLGAGHRIELNPLPISIHRPSAEQLFSSVAEHAGPSGVGVLLTGMGEDGAHGMLEMKQRGARTIAQDEESCAVYGMPRAAHRLGAVDILLPLDQVAAAIRRAVTEVRV